MTTNHRSYIAKYDAIHTERMMSETKSPRLLNGFVVTMLAAHPGTSDVFLLKPDEGEQFMQLFQAILHVMHSLKMNAPTVPSRLPSTSLIVRITITRPEFRYLEQPLQEMIAWQEMVGALGLGIERRCQITDDFKARHPYLARTFSMQNFMHEVAECAAGMDPINWYRAYDIIK